jgi:hypothetical protein
VVDARRATVVAFYGAKPRALTALVEELQALGCAQPGVAFRPRPLTEVHATLLGLESPSGAASSWPDLDPAPLAAELVAALDRERPRLQLGGFAPDCAAFRSRGQLPYERSLTLHGDLLVLMGWTTSAGSGRADPVAIPGELRRASERFGVRHKYHGPGAPTDCDLHLVIGAVDADPPARAALLATGRDRLAARRTDVDLTADALSLVEYESTALPVATSRWRGLREVIRPREQPAVPQSRHGPG